MGVGVGVAVGVGVGVPVGVGVGVAVGQSAFVDASSVSDHGPWSAAYETPSCRSTPSPHARTLNTYLVLHSKPETVVVEDRDRGALGPGAGMGSDSLLLDPLVTYQEPEVPPATFR